MIKKNIGRSLNHRYKLFGFGYFGTIFKTDKSINIKFDWTPTTVNCYNFI